MSSGGRRKHLWKDLLRALCLCVLMVEKLDAQALRGTALHKLYYEVDFRPQIKWLPTGLWKELPNLPRCKDTAKVLLKGIKKESKDIHSFQLGARLHPCFLLQWFPG